MKDSKNEIQKPYKSIDEIELEGRINILEERYTHLKERIQHTLWAVGFLGVLIGLLSLGILGSGHANCLNIWEESSKNSHFFGLKHTILGAKLQV